MQKCLIVAIGQNNEIGVKGALPWHISADLQYFKRTTKGFPVIMGRTTYFSLPVMKLNPNLKSLFDFQYEDFTLEGYDPWPAIKAPVAV